MNRIQLRKLLNLTEQAPQPPMGGDPASPVPAPMAPPAGMNAGMPDQQPPMDMPAPEPEMGPEPEDPSEYDFTKDFRTFEDKKNKAEADAKKVLLDKMNKRLLNKTIVANASRGYGQPKTDYTIENVKKVSVEFWYKDYVVIVTDENDKKYFLTPGINIKIESEGGEAEPEAQPAGQPQDVAQPPQPQPEQPPAQEEPAGAEEVPNVPPPGGEQQPAPEQEPAMPPQQPQPEQEPVPPQQPPKKKKKLPVTEWLQKDLNKFLTEFMSNRVKDGFGKVNYLPYLSETLRVISKDKDVTKIKWKLIIPENHMVTPLDSRDIKLNAIDILKEVKCSGKYSKGSVDIIKNGRYYFLEYIKEIGWQKQSNLNEMYGTSNNEREEKVDPSEVPASIDDLFSTHTQYVAGENANENEVRWVEEVKRSAKVLYAKKVYGYGDDFKKSAPDDYFYEVNFSVVEPGWYADDGPDKVTHKPLQNQWLFGVSKDGKNKQLFAS